MNMRASLNPFLGFVLFTALNLVLLFRDRNSVPKRDIFAYGVGLVGVVIAVNRYKPGDVILEKTDRFRKMFGILSGTETFFTLLVPWWLILLNGGDQYALAPHLFIFQTQIALECIIFMTGDNPELVFRYTCIANSYRALALFTWVSRSVNSQDRATLLLSGIAGCLWICSNLFMTFEWYPLLKRKKGSETTMKNE